MVAAPPAAHPVTDYARGVAQGEIIASRLVRLACERHLRDLEEGAERGLWFNEAAADYAIDFFARLQLAEGRWSGRPFVLRPWQAFIVGSLFGWQQRYGECATCGEWNEARPADGLIHCEACYPGDLDYFEAPGEHGWLRRFRYGYVEIAKGNGKSPLAAGIGLKLLAADGEASAEVYTAAVNREQAGIAFRDASLMASASRALSKRLDVGVRNIAYPLTNSFLRPVSSEGKGLDGKRVHGCVIDELHEHPTDIVVEKMRAGTKGRRQALVLAITNSGYNRATICYQQHEMSVRVLEGSIANDAWFAYVCGLDPCAKHLEEGRVQPDDECQDCDQWTDERVWLKANPNLGVSVTVKYLREQVAEALGMPAKQNIVKRLNFCIWTASSTKWLPADDWAACGDLPRGRGPCVVGFDLSATNDLTAVAKLWGPDDEGAYDVEVTGYISEQMLDAMAQKRGVPYPLWVQQGYLRTTPGPVIDYSFIRRDINAIDAAIGIREIGGDPWNATQFQTWLNDDGYTVVPVRQGFATMTAPCKELERLVKAHKIRHGGNPILAWAAGNVVVDIDAAGNIKPSKEKSSDKIDPIVALLCGLSRALVAAEGFHGFYIPEPDDDEEEIIV